MICIECKHFTLDDHGNYPAHLRSIDNPNAKVFAKVMEEYGRCTFPVKEKFSDILPKSYVRMEMPIIATDDANCPCFENDTPEI